MHRGYLSLLTLGASGAVQAHVSATAGVHHAVEHLWLLLALLPATLLLRPLLQRLRARGRR